MESAFACLPHLCEWDMVSIIMMSHIYIIHSGQRYCSCSVHTYRLVFNFVKWDVQYYRVQNNCSQAAVYHLWKWLKCYISVGAHNLLHLICINTFVVNYGNHKLTNANSICRYPSIPAIPVQQCCYIRWTGNHCWVNDIYQKIFWKIIECPHKRCLVLT